MFIIRDKEDGLQIHFDAPDMEDFIEVGGNVRITLSADRAKELEDRLEKALK